MKQTQFKNTDVLSHIDWNKEIVDPKIEKLSEKEIQDLAIRVVLRWNMVKDYFKDSINSKEEHVRQNTLRILQYFYGRFVYYHAFIYSKYHKHSVDIKKNMTEDMKKYIKDNKKLTRSKISLKDIKQIQAVFDKEIDKLIKEEEKKFPDGGVSEVKKMLKAEGLSPVNSTAWNKLEDRDAVALIHDGVEYNVYMMKASKTSGKRTKTIAKDLANKYRATVKRYHSIIKPIYKEIKKRSKGQIYAMPGGGSQHQIFFGNSKGYIAILHLDLISSRKNSSEYTLISQGLSGDSFLKGFKMDGIKHVTSESIYGRKQLEKWENE